MKLHPIAGGIRLVQGFLFDLISHARWPTPAARCFNLDPAALRSLVKFLEA